MSEPNVSVVLNHLIETCKDGEKGFRAAADLVGDQAIKALFLKIAVERAQFAGQLLPFAQILGGGSVPEGSAGASVHRQWMDLRSLLSGHGDRSVLTEVLRGDGVTLLAFKTAVNSVLPMNVRDLVESQYAELCKQHEQLSELDREWKQAS